MKRRVLTAREQVGMLAPWRTAAPVPGKRPRMTTQDVIDQVRDAHGIDLEMVNTGGGCYVLEGRLEDGSWLRAADYEDFCHPELANRHGEEERDNQPGGWDVSFHSNEHDPGGTWKDPRTGEVHEYGPSDTWASGDVDPIHWHSDPNARVEDLPRVIGDALRSMPPGAKQRQQERLRETLRQYGHEPGSEEWARHFPGEGGKSILDYEGLINPRDDLDDDFGHIFGSRRRTAQMGWDEVMRHIDETLSEGEGHDLNHFPGARDPGRKELWGDWRKVPHDSPDAINWVTYRYRDPGEAERYYNHWMATTENGKQLHAFADEDPSGYVGWSWFVGDRGNHNHPPAGARGYGLDAGNGMDTPHLHDDEYDLPNEDNPRLYRIDTREQAMAEAEQAFEDMFPTGGGGVTRRLATAREQVEMLSPWREGARGDDDPLHSVPTGDLLRHRLFNPAITTPEDYHDSLYWHEYGSDGLRLPGRRPSWMSSDNGQDWDIPVPTDVHRRTPGDHGFIAPGSGGGTEHGLVEAIERGERFDPVRITTDGEEALLTDGNHRVEVADMMSVPELDTRIQYWPHTDELHESYDGIKIDHNSDLGRAIHRVVQDYPYRPVSEHGFEEDKDWRRMVFRRDPSTGLWARGEAYEEVDARRRRDLRGTEHEWDGPGAYHRVRFPDGTRYVHERHLHARLRDDSGVDYSDLDKFLEEGL